MKYSVLLRFFSFYPECIFNRKLELVGLVQSLKSVLYCESFSNPFVENTLKARER